MSCRTKHSGQGPGRPTQPPDTGSGPSSIVNVTTKGGSGATRPENPDFRCPSGLGLIHSPLNSLGPDFLPAPTPQPILRVVALGGLFAQQGKAIKARRGELNQKE